MILWEFRRACRVSCLAGAANELPNIEGEGKNVKVDLYSTLPATHAQLTQACGKAMLVSREPPLTPRAFDPLPPLF